MAAVHIYAAYGADTESNGLAIIHPISGTVRMEKNSVYDAEFTTDADIHGKFRYVQIGALAKIPVRYHGRITKQLFRIYDTDNGTEASGRSTVKAKAKHIFYDLTASMLTDCRPTQLAGADAIAWMLNGVHGGAVTAYTFASDIERMSTAYYQNVNLVAALLGADNAFVTRWGGALYRDNYYFSLHEEMEGCMSTGVIRYGYNMQSISFKINDSKCITDLIAEDNFGNTVEIHNPDVPSQRFPLHRYGYTKFQYDEEDVEQLRTDAQAYFDKYAEPTVSIKVKIADLHDVELYKDFINLAAYEVGDRVVIYHSELGISYKNLEIIAKTYDFVNDITTSTEIGSFRDAIIRETA